jgi:2'-5' RNA ligase
MSVSSRPGRALGRSWKLARGRWRKLRRSANEVPRETVLLVPVAAGPVLTASCDWYSSAQADGMPMHVTLLSPFLSSDEIDEQVGRDLAAIMARQPSFVFQLGRIGRFPDAVYVQPEPSAPFVGLTEAIVARWPGRPPYGGRFADVIPHVTVTDGQEPPGLLDALVRSLPVQATATEAWLMAPTRDGSWSLRQRFPLGG